MDDLKLYVVDGIGSYARSRSMVAAYSAEQAISLAEAEVSSSHEYEFDADDTWEPHGMPLSDEVVEPGVLLDFEYGE